MGIGTKIAAGLATAATMYGLATYDIGRGCFKDTPSIDALYDNPIRNIYVPNPFASVNFPNPLENVDAKKALGLVALLGLAAVGAKKVKDSFK
jgi:hypothetical protein